MRESLYTIETDIETREKRIQEVLTDKDVILSDKKVQAVVEKWEVIESASSSLRPVLQVSSSCSITIVVIIDTRI